MPEILFYHLERQSLEQVLPSLLEKSMQRGWRAAIQCGDPERMKLLDTHLWIYDDASFLPHGSTKDGKEADQPIWMTVESENPNGAQIRFFVDGAAADFANDELEEYDRLIFLFDGHNQDAVGQARAQWKEVTDAGFAATYWRQNEAGRWSKMA